MPPFIGRQERSLVKLLFAGTHTYTHAEGWRALSLVVSLMMGWCDNDRHNLMANGWAHRDRWGGLGSINPIPNSGSVTGTG